MIYGVIIRFGQTVHSVFPFLYIEEAKAFYEKAIVFTVRPRDESEDCDKLERPRCEVRAERPYDNCKRAFVCARPTLILENRTVGEYGEGLKMALLARVPDTK